MAQGLFVEGCILGAAAALVTVWFVRDFFYWRRFEAFLAAEERRKARAMLPGWTCETCLAFNGEAKERRETCRACNAGRPS